MLGNRLNEAGSLSQSHDKSQYDSTTQTSEIRWAKEHRDLSVNDWNRVVFRNELRTGVHACDDKRKVVWKLQTERKSENNFNFQFNLQVSITNFGCIFSKGPGTLCLVNGNGNSE